MHETYPDTSEAGIIRAKAPTRGEKYTIRALIIGGVLAMTIFVYWFAQPEHIGFSVLFWLLTVALAFKLFKMLHEWYHYWDVSVPVIPEVKTQHTVDILTTACPGEPKEMILATIRAMQKVKYPHTSYLCDEGDDPELKQACNELGVVHVTRKEKTNAKAGNINNALKQATGDICVILDPDHVPDPEFLHRVLPYFEDPNVGYVQIVQAYGNQSESFIARGAAEQTYHFYGPMMMCMNSYGTSQAIGANCTFRREALDSIGGHAPGLSEDMHTAMQIHAKGWKSVYVPEILSRGLVPSTLSGYYKQQLKWSRGTFELLFVTYPKLFKNFSWRQRLHYLTLPFYFLFGLITLIDILVPIIALIAAQVPWEVDLADFSILFIPLCTISLSIRMFAQRWLLEKSERGLHLAGGLLRMSTWWIFLMGFIYTILRINVPYIPTPKNDEPVNNWKLSLPNLIACLACIAAVIYGLSIDWNPYSMVMATYALINAAILGFVVLIGQEKLLINVKKYLKRVTHFDLSAPFRNKIYSVKESFYNVLGNGTVMFLIITAALFYSYTTINKNADTSMIPDKIKKTGGFYTGVYIPEVDKSFSVAPVKKLEISLGTSFDIVSFYTTWGCESVEKFPMTFLNECAEKGAVPMITWEPWAVCFPEVLSNPELGKDKKMLSAISRGVFNKYLTQYGNKLKEYGKPVFLRFAHEFDNPAYPWSPKGENTPEDFVNAWRYVYTYFLGMGISNVAWVWNPWTADAMDAYFPGETYIDWIGVDLLNYGYAASNGKWFSFDELYQPFNDKIKSNSYFKNKPVMLCEFGSTPYGGDRTVWLNDAMNSIKKNHKEIKSIVFFNSSKDKNWATNWRPENGDKYIDWSFSNNAATSNSVKDWLNEKPFSDKPKFKSAKNYGITAKKISRPYLRESFGNFDLLVDGKPYYVKGVAYNPAHDWRDGNLPLTRRQLLKDFTKIKSMGANTIRRYSPGFYDRNILNVADELDLKVLYGFYFSPEVDFLDDTDAVEDFIENIEETVLKYKDYNAVLGWSIGNEVWGLLKHHYNEPYLSFVRNKYINMIEVIAQRIHEVDPNRPVFSMMEHTAHLPCELVAFHNGATSLDIIGVNSYYFQQISQLNELVTIFDEGRPYLVSEFGPKGYWDPLYSTLKNDSILIEENDEQKAFDYTVEWDLYVNKYRGKNIGGVAFCWRDRMEGSNTWFGITDYKGRLKPAYYALQNAWTINKTELTLKKAEIRGPKGYLKRGAEYVYRAQVDGNKNLKYEWYLYRNDFDELINSTTSIADGSSVRVRLPKDKSLYRLYLYVSDEKGNVLASSEPIAVK